MRQPTPAETRAFRLARMQAQAKLPLTNPYPPGPEHDAFEAGAGQAKPSWLEQD